MQIAFNELQGFPVQRFANAFVLMLRMNTKRFEPACTVRKDCKVGNTDHLTIFIRAEESTFRIPVVVPCCLDIDIVTHGCLFNSDGFLHILEISDFYDIIHKNQSPFHPIIANHSVQFKTIHCGCIIVTCSQ